MQNIQFDPEATVRNILLANKFDARHVTYAERKLLDEGQGLHAVAVLVQNRYGVTRNYAKALVAKVLAGSYSAEIQDYPNLRSPEIGRTNFTDIKP